MHEIRLAVSRDVVGKATSPEQHAALSKYLEPAKMNMYELHEHLAVKGNAICCSSLKQESNTNKCRRREESFISSQIIGIDIDHGQMTLEDIERDPFLIENAAFAYTTPSHTPEHPRLRIIFVLESPITSIQAYKERVNIIADRYEGDTNARDAVRIWYGNKDAQTIWFKKTLSSAVLEQMLGEAEKAQAQEVRYKAFAEKELDRVDLRAMLRFIPAKQDHMDWKRTYSGVFNYYGCDEEICAILQEWSPSTLPYERQYRNRLIRIGIGTAIYIAKKHGYEPPSRIFKPEPKNATEAYDAAEEWLRSAAEFRFNDVTLHVEYKTDGDIWEPISDYFVNSCLRKMRASGIKIPVSKLWEIAVSDFAPKFHPFKAYFDSLPQWNDDDPNYIMEVVKCIPVDKDFSRLIQDGDTFHYRIFKKWFVASFACSYHNHPNQIMPILQGGQGIGKTRFVRALCPDVLKKQHYYEGSISADKDDKLVLASSFMAVDDELESLNRREAEAMKAIITKATDRVRPPYQRAAIELKRVVNFIGSVNKRTFLNDETGSRRFPTIPVSGMIDMERLAEIDIDKVWAQAKALYEMGEHNFLDGQETIAVNKYNEAFQQKTMTDDLVEQYVKPSNNQNERPKTATQIAFAIAKEVSESNGPPIHTDQRFIAALGKSLVKAGHDQKSKRIEDKVYHGYYVYVAAGSYIPVGDSDAGF